MYRIPGSTKRNPALRWSLPDRIFFACGACHVLAYAFLERYGPVGLKALWIKPAAGFTGNHIFVAADEGWAFDYHGCSCRQRLLDHAHHKAGRWWRGWTASLIELPPDVLVSEAKSRTCEGLWLQEPKQFLHDAMPRARTYLNRFPAPV